MSDIPHQGSFAAALRKAAIAPATRRRPWPLLPYVCVFVAGAVGLLAGRAMGGEAAAFEDKLLILLRFMAAMKLVGVVAAAAVTHWRLAQPISPRLAGAYLISLATMALAPGLIWSLGGIAIGALLFHAGLIAFLVLAWRDDATQLLPRRR